MRTNINLATQPYEDARLYLSKWGSLVLVLALATAGLAWFTVHSVRRSSDINRQLSTVRREIDKYDRAKAQAEQTLNLPQNRGTVEKSEYLNSILARKAFSWTTVFSDMEKIMPPGLRVLSISPALDAQNQLEVHIMVGGASRDRAIELVQNLEKTPRFRDVALRSDTFNEITTTTGRSSQTTSEEQDPIRFDIVAHYLPNIPNTEPSTNAEAPAEKSAVAKNGGQP